MTACNMKRVPHCIGLKMVTQLQFPSALLGVLTSSAQFWSLIFLSSNFFTIAEGILFTEDAIIL